MAVLVVPPVFGQSFVHPGCLSTSNDFARMKAKVQATAHPWIDSYNILIGNSYAQSNYTAHAVPILQRGSGGGACLASDNYQNAYRDAAAAYQLSLRWQITGNNAYADTAINVLNTWANTCTNLCGDPNIALLSLYGYQFACAGENLRTYTNWAAADFANFQSWMTNKWYPLAHSFMSGHFGACATHTWANWDLCTMNTILSIGVLCDRRDIYNEAINYYKTGAGAGAASQVMAYSHPGYLGQCQESGRDQGHCTLDPVLLSVFCEIAWNQGDDIYGYGSNTLLQVSEYVSKYNVQPLNASVPFVCYINCEYYNSGTEYSGVTPVVATGSRGTVRPGWSLIYSHYANRLGVAAPWTSVMASQVNPEGGGGNYGGNSGGYDQLGFTTLTHTLDPIATNAVSAPSTLIAQPRNNVVTLSWFGSTGATNYNVKRATVLGGPYTTIGSASSSTVSYTDIGLTQGSNYFYAVSAVINGVETTNSAPVSATPNLQVSGTIIGSSGSYQSAGADKKCLFDGSLKNCYDAANGSGDWGGLDLGRSNVITQVAYCPRTNYASRMVGGQFQGCNVSNFTSGVVTLYTIGSQPLNNTLTNQTISNTNAFRYVRYIGPTSGSCNAAEIQFFGAPPVPVAPNVPRGLQATPGNGQVLLDWSAPDAAITFNVYRSKTSGGTYTLVASNITTTTYTDKGLSNNTYFYVVSAINASGESPYSAQDSATLSGSGVWAVNASGDWSETNRWSGGTIANGAAYTADFSTISLSADRTITLDNSRAIGTLKFRDVGGSHSWTITNTGGSVLTLDNGTSTQPSVIVSNNVTIAASIDGTSGFSKSGPGTLILAGDDLLSGTINIDTSSTTSGDGIVRAAHPSALNNVTLVQIRNNNSGTSTFQLDGSAGDINIPADFSINCRNNSVPTLQNLAGTNTLAGDVWLNTGGNMFNIQSDAGLLVFSGINQYIGSLTGARSYNFSGAGDFWVNGPILNSTNGALIALTKSGTGVLTLSDDNTYGAGTTVNGGTLIVDGMVTGVVTIASGATLAGSGVISGAVTVANGATLSPGSSPGTLTILGNLTLNNTSTLAYEFGASSDQTVVNGNLTLDGALVVTDAGGFTAGNYTLFIYTGTLVNNGLTVAPLPGGYAGTILAGGGVVVLIVTTTFASWQNRYFGSTNCAFCAGGADFDGDGLSNSNEFLAGFNPTNNGASLRIVNMTATGVDVNVTYLGANGDNSGSPGPKTNVLEFAGGSYTDNFASAGQTNILAGGIGLGTNITVVDPYGATNIPARYYRVRVLTP